MITMVVTIKMFENILRWDAVDSVDGEDEVECSLMTKGWSMVMIIHLLEPGF